LSGPDDPTGSPYTWTAGGRATTDREGRFTVTGVLSPGDYAARVWAEGFAAPGMRAFVVGARHWDAVLERYGGLEGSVLLAEGIRPELIVVDVKLRPSDPTVDTNVRHNTQLHPDGSFRLASLPPGLVDVHLHIEGESDTLATIESVSIPSGGEATDARLRPIDLRELVRRQIVITIVGPDERPVASAAVAIRPAGDHAGPSRRILCEDGQLTILSRSPAVDLELQAHGMRVARREAVATDQTIVMEAGLPITVQLPATFALPEAPAELALVLCPMAIEAATLHERLYLERGGYNYIYYNWFIGQAPKFGANREVSIHLPHPGAYRIDWMVAEGAVGTQSTLALRSTQGIRELRVLESDAGRVFLLAPDPAELAAALAELRAR